MRFANSVTSHRSAASGVGEGGGLDRVSGGEFRYLLVVTDEECTGAAGGAQVPVEHPARCRTSRVFVLLDDSARVVVDQVMDDIPAGPFLRDEVCADERVE